MSYSKKNKEHSPVTFPPLPQFPMQNNSAPFQLFDPMEQGPGNLPGINVCACLRRV